MRLKIGELAKNAGLSVLALHHYDAIRVLSPSQRGRHCSPELACIGHRDLSPLVRPQLRSLRGRQTRPSNFRFGSGC